jgi:uncharacterized membrane protein
MSSTLIEAIDLTESAQNAIATAIENKTIPVADLANAVAELAAINATLLAELSAIRQKLAANSQQSITLSLQCCPHPIHDCETGETRWIDPPRKIGGNEGGTIITEDGGVSIHDAIDNIGTDGMADGEYDFGENDGSGRGYTTTTDPEATICDNANWFVYSCSKLMDEASSVWGVVGFTVDSYAGLLSTMGFIGVTPLFYVTAGSAAAATFITVGVSAAAIVAVVALIDKLLSLAGAGLKAQWSSQLEADLVCAIVTGANTGGGDGIKREWDRVVNIYVPAINPLRWYYKYLLTKDMANALAKGQLQEGEAKYGYGCACAGGGGRMVSIWKSFDGGGTWTLDATLGYYYIWPDGEGVAEVGDEGCPWNATRFTFSDTDNSYDPTCRRNHSGDLNGYRIRETTGVGAAFRANTNPPYCDSWGIGLNIPADGSWVNINQATEFANIRSGNPDFNIEIEVQP